MVLVVEMSQKECLPVRKNHDLEWPTCPVRDYSEEVVTEVDYARVWRIWRGLVGFEFSCGVREEKRGKGVGAARSDWMSDVLDGCITL